MNGVRLPHHRENQESQDLPDRLAPRVQPDCQESMDVQDPRVRLARQVKPDCQDHSVHLEFQDSLERLAQLVHPVQRYIYKSCAIKIYRNSSFKLIPAVMT